MKRGIVIITVVVIFLAVCGAGRYRPYYPEYLRHDGTVALTADWNMGAYDIYGGIDANFTGEVKGGTLESTGGAAASGTRALAWGEGAIASGEDSVALGGLNGSAKLGYYYTTASDIDTIAIGSGAWATSPYAIGIGWRANAAIDYGIALGREASASGAINAVAIGYLATASGQSAVALGTNLTASGNGSVSIGSGFTNAADGTVAIGIDNPALTATSTLATLPLNTQIGDNSADEATCVGRFIPRTLAADPTGTPTAGTQGEIAVYNDKAYLKTVGTGTDTNWSALN